MSVPIWYVDPGSFSHVEGDTYYTELFAFAMLKNFQAAGLAGYEIPVVASEDITALQSSFASGVDSVVSWFTSALTATEGGTPRDLPAVLGDWLPAVAGGAVTWATGGSVYALMLVQGVINLGFRLLESWLTRDSNFDFSDLPEIISKAFLKDGQSILEKATLLDGVAILNKGLLDSEGDSLLSSSVGGADIREIASAVRQGLVFDPETTNVPFLSYVRSALESLRDGLIANPESEAVPFLRSLREALDVMLASFRLELDAESSKKSASVSFTGVLAEVSP